MRARANEILGSLPDQAVSEKNPITDAKVPLGSMLSFATRLSRVQRISRNSGHGLTSPGFDGQPTSPGYAGQRGSSDPPTVFNAGFHIAPFCGGLRDLP